MAETRVSTIRRNAAETGKAPVMAAIGLMSGTSLDGVDAALLTTDGEAVAEPGKALTVPYPEHLRRGLGACLGETSAPPALVRSLTEYHLEAVTRLMAAAGLSADQVSVVGFHGQTIHHDPAARLTCQIGDPAWLARQLGIQVVADFRAADVAAGGQGAPLAPLYHAALAGDLARPAAILNLGGVGNVTWVGDDGASPGVLAFDTGPGNALIDDWVRARTGAAFDRDGRLAAQGRVDDTVVAGILDDPYFRRAPPKSLDRQHFQALAAEMLAGHDTVDGAATLVAVTAATVAAAECWFPAEVQAWWVCGGGRHNPAIMARLSAALGAPVAPVEALDWSGDALEAQAFAYLAVRALRGLPLSLPSTTGVARALSGGRRFSPQTGDPES